jgi:galactosamine-6-phosphate isomerase
MIDFRICRDAGTLDCEAGKIVLDAVRRKPDLVLCAATGMSPTGLYAYLAQHAKQEPALFGRMRVLKLDEWLGLPLNDPGSCESYIDRHVLRPLGVTRDRYFGFDAHAGNPTEECARVHDQVVELGIDVAVLGVGADGHIGLNRPAATLPPFAHVVAFDPSARPHAMLTGRGPTGGMTLGMGELLSAETIVLLAPGIVKRAVVDRLAHPTVTTEFPVSLLWLHPRSVCLTCPWRPSPN